MDGRTSSASLFLSLCVVFLGLAGIAPGAEPGKYLGPCDVAAAKDGKSLLVLCVDAHQVLAVGVDGRVGRRIDLPAKPTGMVLSPDGKTLYVTCARPEGMVCLVQMQAGAVTATIPAGHTATAPTVSPDGKRLYVCNRFNDDVSVIDIPTRKQLARVPVSREPIASVITPDGKLLLVSNHLPADRADQYGVVGVTAVVTGIDTATNKTWTIRLTRGSSSVRGICVSPDGKYAYVVHVLAHYHLPTIQLEKGWMNTNVLSVIDTVRKKLINTVLLDEEQRGAANPWAITRTSDGKSICVSHAGSHELSVINITSVVQRLNSLPLAGYSHAAFYGTPQYEYAYTDPYSSTAADVPNALTFLQGLRRRFALGGNGPRGLAVVGSKVYVAEYFSDTLAIVDLDPKSGKPVTSVTLGPEPVLTTERKGQMYFNDAMFCYDHWQSCASCHPDARVDGLNWDLLNDGQENPKNVKSMLLAHKTPPAMASGCRTNGEHAVRSGFKHILFADCPEEDATAVDAYLKSLQPVPSPHLVDGKLSARAQRGKKLFFTEEIGCAHCHPAPLYTDLQMHDVGSRTRDDRQDKFDTPTLIEVWRTAPYMHDGHYLTIKELITRGRHGHNGGNLDKLSEQEIDDLVEFVLSL